MNGKSRSQRLQPIQAFWFLKGVTYQAAQAMRERDGSMVMFDNAGRK